MFIYKVPRTVGGECGPQHQRCATVLISWHVIDGETEIRSSFKIWLISQGKVQNNILVIFILLELVQEVI